MKQKYELLDFLGKGSFGDVWKALDTKTNEMVAIKTVDLVDSEMIPQIRQELETLRQLDDPRITKFYESFIQNGQLYIVMEYLAGGSVADIL